MRFAEVVDSEESLKEFCKINNIVPSEIIVVWEEEIVVTSKSKTQELNSSTSKIKEEGCDKDGK